MRVPAQLTVLLRGKAINAPAPLDLRAHPRALAAGCLQTLLGHPALKLTASRRSYFTSLSTSIVCGRYRHGWDTLVAPRRLGLLRIERQLSAKSDEGHGDVAPAEPQPKAENADVIFMREALLEAQKAFDLGEVPIGAVLVRNGELIARAHNRVEMDRDATSHAEMLCIRQASASLQNWRLLDTTLYVTIEPCPMCAGAILQSRVKRVVWGAPNPLLGAAGSWVALLPTSKMSGAGDARAREVEDNAARTQQELQGASRGPLIHPYHNGLRAEGGILAEDCGSIMKRFFGQRRTMP